MYSIILVHVGPEFPLYINDCIEQIKRFNTCNIFLITNDNHKDRIIDKSTIFVPISDLKINEKHRIFNQTTKLDRVFRNGFWKYATERFFYIEELMEQFRLDNVFHLENDNLLYLNIEEQLLIFINNYELAVISDNEIRVIPGFLFIKNVQILSEFTSFILNKNSNDMELLSLFKFFSKKIENLPILPLNYDLEFRSLNGLTSCTPQKYSLHYDKFKSVFDGAAIGQYIGGVDPRNPEGKISNYVNESCLFNASVFQFEFNLDEKGRKIPYLIYKNEKCRINNLHIHSKNLRKFM
jgi:hypothetical protein